MKIKIDDKEIMELSAIRKQVICNDIHADEFEADIERRLCYILCHKFERCFERLKKEWDPKLKANGVESIPLDEDAYAALVFAQPAYMDRKAREAASKE